MTPRRKHTCNLCNASISNKIDEHIIACTKVNISSGNIDNFILKIIGDNYGTFLYILVPKSINLNKLSYFINKTWMEPCCGHMSIFINKDTRDEYSKNKKILNIPLPCVYEYDMGSTTACLINSICSIKSSNNDIILLMRNTKLELNCSTKDCKHKCDNYCGNCDEVYCNFCTRNVTNHECFEKYTNEENDGDNTKVIVDDKEYTWNEMFGSEFDHYIKPYLNSPRSFVCGYGTE